MTALAHSSHDLRIGSVLDGRYRILDRLCTGGMGVVYRGERLHLGRPVAIKFLLAPLTHDSEQRACFEREAQVMSQLSHPHCVPVTDFGVSDAPYLVMEYVAGRTLKQVLQVERMSPARAVRLARQLLSGLEHAHAQGIVHHDIKPANIMLTDATGVGEQVRVLDFGLAKLREVDDVVPEASAWLAGTPQYMAPEQWQQAGLVDPRSDLYATGIVLFEMLTGRRPFEARAPFELMRAHAEQMPPSLASLCPHLSGLYELEAVVAKVLSKAPSARYGSASEFSAALEALGALPHDTDRLSVDPFFDNDALETTLAATRGVAEHTSPLRFTAENRNANAAKATPRRARKRWLWLSLPIAACLWLGWTLGSSPPGSASSKPAHTIRPRAKRLPIALPSAAETDASPALAAVADEAAAAVPLELSLEAQLEQGQYDAVLTALGPLVVAAPTNARLAYLEGRALYGKGWWREAYARYQAAMEHDGNYRSNRHIAAHLIRGLGSSTAQARAREILREDMGIDALRPLARAARQDHRSEVRARAADLHDEIASAL